MIRKKTKLIAYVAIFAALFYLLSIYGTLKINNAIKFTFQNLPIYLSGILFGGTIAAIVGTIGMLLSQIFSEYGLTITTVLWVLPYTVSGLLSGILYRKFKNYLNNSLFMFIYVFLIHLVITTMNTLALYIDSNIFGYYSFQLVFGILIYKLVNAILISVLYTIVIPILVRVLKNKVQ